MKERPITFSGPMVVAIQEGRKTQTRRIVKQKPIRGMGSFCPYGCPGDHLWVRETWAVAECYDNLSPSQLILTRRNVEYAADTPGYLGNVRGKWRPSIFMPRWANRKL